MKQIRSIHFVGIKGVGMASLAILVKEAGITVTGCDIDQEFITDHILHEERISVKKGFNPEHIKSQDLVITTSAHGGFENREVKAALIKNIPVLTQGQAVGECMKGKILGRSDFIGISVAGTHGKTTTSALLATVLKKNSFDPSYIIGTSSIPSLGFGGHYGSGKFFIAEADEYATDPNALFVDQQKSPFSKTSIVAKFLWQHPYYAIITNIEFDHPDVYPNIEKVKEAFVQFANNIDKNGLLIGYGDDPQVQAVLMQIQRTYITYGFSQKNDYVIHDYVVSQTSTRFQVSKNNKSIGEFTLNILGKHNCLNALSVIILAKELGISNADIRAGLFSYIGSRRRLQYIGTLASGALIFDDYAHHPSEIRSTLNAIKTAYPDHSIAAIFQPHTYSRTKALFHDFTQAFSNADSVIITDIYSSLREKTDSTVSSEDLVKKLSETHKQSYFFPRLKDVVEYINKKKFSSKNILITLGAGDIYKIIDQLDINR